MTDPVVLIIALAAAAAGVGLLEAAIRDTRVGLSVIVVVALMSATLPDLPHLVVSGFNVGVVDLSYGVLGVAAAARYVRGARIADQHVILFLLLLVTLASIARGMGEFGAGPAINEARRFVHLSSGVGYLATVPPSGEWRDRLGNWLLFLAAGFAVLAMGRWLANAGGLTGGVFGEGNDLRTVASDEALFILQGAVVALSSPRRDLRWLRPLGGVFLAVTVLLQHRTVWVLGIVVIAVFVLRNRQLSRQLAVGVVLAAVAMSFFTFIVLAATEGADVEQQLAESATATNTFEWRYEGWRALFTERDPEAADLLFGTPFGAGWERRIGGHIVDATPHNFLIETYLRLGFVGLTALMVWHGRMLHRLRRRRMERSFLSDETLLLLTTALLVYYLTYAPGPEQTILLGILTAASARTPVPRVAARPIDGAGSRTRATVDGSR